jgi:hypothetical protein
MLLRREEYKTFIELRTRPTLTLPSPFRSFFPKKTRFEFTEGRGQTQLTILILQIHK